MFAAMKTIIFDFDGTLADTLDMLVEVVNQLLKEANRPILTDQDVTKLRGMNIQGVMRYLKVPFRMLPQLVNKVRKMLTNRATNLKPIPGIVEVIKQLSKDGHKLGVVSSSSKETINTFLKANGLQDSVTFIDAGLGLLSKSRSLKSCLRKHQLDPSQTIYVGDEVRDIEAARAAGLPIISVAWGLNTRTLLETKRPDHLLDKPAELLKLSQASS